MTRRKMLLVTACATVLGLAALIGFANHSAIFADDDDDEGREGLIKLLDTSKVNLQQGVAASEQQGKPISAEFEVDDGKLTAKLTRVPAIAEVPYPVMMEPNLVVEYYSR